MRKEKNAVQPLVGSSSLLVMVSVLCLTVFALLSLSSVQAQKRLADAAVQSVTDYYEADFLAEEIFAQLRSGQIPEGVEERSGTFAYALPISARQVLQVQLRRENSNWQILRWQAVTVATQIDDSLDVWRGIGNEEGNP